MTLVEMGRDGDGDDKEGMNDGDDDQSDELGFECQLRKSVIHPLYLYDATPVGLRTQPPGAPGWVEADCVFLQLIQFSTCPTHGGINDENTDHK
jgi:hypothetical protein